MLHMYSYHKNIIFFFFSFYLIIIIVDILVYQYFNLFIKPDFNDRSILVPTGL